MGLQLLTEPDLSRNLIIWESIEKAIVDLLCLDIRQKKFNKLLAGRPAKQINSFDRR